MYSVAIEKQWNNKGYLSVYHYFIIYDKGIKKQFA